jgi:hypothetical protein
MNLFILTKCGCPIWRQYYNTTTQSVQNREGKHHTVSHKRIIERFH